MSVEDGTVGTGSVPEHLAPAGDQTPQAPEVHDVSDDTFIRLQGQDKPVKFGEHFRGLQSNFTKASQRAASLERELGELRQQVIQWQQGQQARTQPQSQGQQGDVYEALRALPYLSGEDAVGLVQGIAAQIQYRDSVLLAALKQIQNMQGTLGNLHQTHATQTFDAKISNWLQSWGYPPEAADLAKEVYLAYEGDDLDQEFEQIFKGRWEQLQTIIETQREAKIRNARPQPFIPGRGGDGRPGKPLEIDPRSSPAEVADLLFPTLQGEFGT